jgi:hypothetical protein
MRFCSEKVRGKSVDEDAREVIENTEQKEN